MRTLKRVEARECGGEGGKPGPCPEHLTEEGAPHGTGGVTPKNVKRGRDRLNKGSPGNETGKLTDYQHQAITDLRKVAGADATITTPRFGNRAAHGEHGSATVSVVMKRSDPGFKRVLQYAHTHGMVVTVTSRPDSIVHVNVHAPQRELSQEHKETVRLFNLSQAGDETATRMLADRLQEQGNPLGRRMQELMSDELDPEGGMRRAQNLPGIHEATVGSIFAPERRAGAAPESVDLRRVFTRVKAEEAWESTGVRVDREKGMIYNALLLGLKAKNRRRYTREAREDAVARGIYDGLALYIGPHKKGRFAKRSPNNHAGRLENVRLMENGEVRVDIAVNRESRGGRLAMEVAERFPEHFGLSQHAWVNGYEENGEQIVTSIAEVAVADLIKDPGTTTNIFEDVTVDTTEVTEQTEGALATDPPVETGAGDTGPGPLIKQLIGEIHDDDSIPDDVKMKATKQLMALKKLLGLGGDEGDGGEGDDTTDETDAPEAVDLAALQARVAALEARRPAKPPRSAPRSEVTEEVTPRPKPVPVALPTDRAGILKAWG